MKKATKSKTLSRVSTMPLFVAAICFSAGAPLSIAQSHSTLPPVQEQDSDTTHRQIVEMDRFLDSHPEIAEQLSKNPSLINSKEFVENHQALQEYLEKHPGVREEFTENPNAFMRRENRFERNEGDRDYTRADNDKDRDTDRDRGNRGDDHQGDNRNRRDDDHDITRRQVAEMDRFLDSHPEIAEQLRRDPSLINNQEFVENHRSLQQYLQEHPGVREEITENPNAFMRREDRYDRREGDRDRGMMAQDRDNRNRIGDPDGQLTSFGHFLGGQSAMAQQLSKDPSLVNNREYMANHPELAEYLKAHPGVSDQLKRNPQAVMGSTWVQQATGTSDKYPAAAAPKPKTNPNQ